MSFQTVLSIVGVAFTAFELYQRFRQKDSSGWDKCQTQQCPKSDFPNNSGASRGTKTERSPELSRAERGPER